MKMANINEAWGHLEAWYADNQTAGDQPISIDPMKTMVGSIGWGWMFRVDYEDKVALVRVGPRGAINRIITLTDDQIQELR